MESRLHTVAQSLAVDAPLDVESLPRCGEEIGREGSWIVL